MTDPDLTAEADEKTIRPAFFKAVVIAVLVVGYLAAVVSYELHRRKAVPVLRQNLVDEFRRFRLDEDEPLSVDREIQEKHERDRLYRKYAKSEFTELEFIMARSE